MRALRVALALLVIPLVASVTPGCAEFFLLHPSRGQIPGADTAVEGGVELAFARDRESGGRPRVLAFIGNASRAERAAPRWKGVLGDLAGDVAAVNYPGYGRSDGEADLDAILPAALRARDAFDAEILAGNSLGAAIALAAAAHGGPPRLLILQNTPPLRSLILKRHGWWNLWLLALPVALQVPAELDAIRNARACQCPAIFLVACHDQTVPASYQDDVIDAYAGPKVVIRYAGGHNRDLPDDARRALREAIRERFGGG